MVRYLVLLAGAALFGAHASAVTPVQKVITMMTEMKAKGIKEKDEEAVQFAKFQQFCKDTASEKEYSIANSADTIAQLYAKSQKYDSDAKVLSEEIASLDASVAEAESDKAVATKEREQQHADYMNTHADYVESISDLVQGVTRLKQMMSASPGASAAASSLLQEFAGKPVLKHAKQVLTAFLSTSEEGFAAAPEASIFESQSGGIVEMMKQLQDKMEDEKETIENEEAAASHSFDMMAQSFTSQIDSQTATRNKKATLMKGKEEASAQAKSDLNDEEATKASDEKYLAEVTQTCNVKASDFESRQTLRAQELDALTKAIEIISDGAVSGAAEKHLPAASLTQTALVQLRSSTVTVNSNTANTDTVNSNSANSNSDSNKKIDSNANTVTQARANQRAAAGFLKVQGHAMKSKILLALAIKVSEDPFSKVKKMIKDMVVKLMEEANDEAEHKGWCDTELGTNKQTRDEKTATSGELTASIEQMTAQTQKLASDIADLSAEVTALDEAVAEATSIRQAEKEKNTETIADAKAAAIAVESAMTVLKEFYDKAATATAFVQTKLRGQHGKAAQMPETFDKPFTGMGGEGGIMGMLEVILSDFNRLLTETTESEFMSDKDYDKFMAQSSEDKAVKQTDIKHKQNKKVSLESDLQAAKGDLRNTQEELDAAMSYYEKLKPSCIDAGENYEERVARRKEEIESLGEALKILAGEEI